MIRQTKKRDRALHVALSLDDYLYEKFLCQEKEIRRQAELYLKNPRKYWRIIRKTKDGNYILEKIIQVNVSSFGTELVIE